MFTRLICNTLEGQLPTTANATSPQFGGNGIGLLGAILESFRNAFDSIKSLLGEEIAEKYLDIVNTTLRNISISQYQRQQIAGSDRELQICDIEKILDVIDSAVKINMNCGEFGSPVFFQNYDLCIHIIGRDYVSHNYLLRRGVYDAANYHLDLSYYMDFSCQCYAERNMKPHTLFPVVAPVNTYAAPVNTYAASVITCAAPVNTYVASVNTYAAPVNTQRKVNKYGHSVAVDTTPQPAPVIKKFIASRLVTYDLKAKNEFGSVSGSLITEVTTPGTGNNCLFYSLAGVLLQLSEIATDSYSRRELYTTGCSLKQYADEYRKNLNIPSGYIDHHEISKILNSALDRKNFPDVHILLVVVPTHHETWMPSAFQLISNNPQAAINGKISPIILRSSHYQPLEFSSEIDAKTTLQCILDSYFHCSQGLAQRIFTDLFGSY